MTPFRLSRAHRGLRRRRKTAGGAAPHPKGRSGSGGWRARLSCLARNGRVGVPAALAVGWPTQGKKAAASPLRRRAGCRPDRPLGRPWAVLMTMGQQFRQLVDGLEFPNIDPDLSAKRLVKSGPVIISKLRPHLRYQGRTAKQSKIIVEIVHRRRQRNEFDVRGARALHQYGHRGVAS